MRQQFNSSNITTKAIEQYHEVLNHVLQVTHGRCVVITIVHSCFETFKACYAGQTFNELKKRVGAYVIVDPFEKSGRNVQAYQFFTDVFSSTRFTNTFEEADAIALNAVGLPFL